MDYQISKTRKLYLILSSCFLILNYIILGFAFIIVDLGEMNSIENSIYSIVYIIASSYILLSFIDFFKYYKLKIIILLIWIIFITDVGNQLLNLFHSYYPIVPDYYNYALNIITFLTWVIWVILVFRLDTEDYSGIQYFHKYSHSIIYSIGIAFTFLVIIMMLDLYEYSSLAILPNALPYIFVIYYALNIKLIPNLPTNP